MTVISMSFFFLFLFIYLTNVWTIYFTLLLVVLICRCKALWALCMIGCSINVHYYCYIISNTPAFTVLVDSFFHWSHIMVRFFSVRYGQSPPLATIASGAMLQMIRRIRCHLERSSLWKIIHASFAFLFTVHFCTILHVFCTELGIQENCNYEIISYLHALNFMCVIFETVKSIAQERSLGKQKIGSDWSHWWLSG